MIDDGHRAATGAEHDPQNGKLHGCCVRCGVPWPCEAENQWQRIRDLLESAAQHEHAYALSLRKDSRS